MREEFWNDIDSPARRLVDRALEPYERWWNARTFPDHVRVRRGLLPGDFTATIEKRGTRFGVAGLCTAFLQVTGDDYEGRLAVSPHQLVVAAGGDVPAWIARHDAALLVTHHPVGWLAEQERRRFEAAIYPAGRFAAHLSAHLHESTRLVEREKGDRTYVRAPSFFGIDAWEDRRGRPGERCFGYVAGRIVLSGNEGRIEALPRTWDKEMLRPAFTLAELDSDGVITRSLAPFPKILEAGPGPAIERSALRDALASVYRSPGDALRLAREVGLHLGVDVGRGAAVDVWHVAVNEADRRDRLGDLVKIANLEYPEAREIVEAWAAFERAARHTPEVLGGGRRSTEEKLADALYDALAKLQPVVFDAVLSALSLTEPIPSPSAPQTTRAMALVRVMERDGLTGLERLAAVVMYVSALPLPPPQRREPDRAAEPGIGAWLLPFAGGMAVGALLAMLVALAKQRATSRRPTATSLRQLLIVMFSDERDFDGFVLDCFPAVYRRFTNGMSRAYRIGLLLDATDPADVVARLQRSHPSAFAAHQRVLDYEDVDEPRATPERWR